MAMNSFKKMIMMANQAPKKQNRVFWNQIVSGAVGVKAELNSNGNYENIVNSVGRISFAFNGIYGDGKNAATIGHKYLVRTFINFSSTGDIAYFYWYACNTYQLRMDYHTQSQPFRDDRIIRCNYDRAAYINARNANSSPATGWEAEFNLYVHDLTLMFGAGNEPATVEEFEQRIKGIPVDIYAYNEGEWIEWDTKINPNDYLTFESLSDGLKLQYTKGTSTFKCSTDLGLTWQDWLPESYSPILNVGDKLLVKCVNPVITSTNGIGRITSDQEKSYNYKVSGDIMSMLYGDDAAIHYSLKGYDRCFSGFLQSGRLLDAGDLVLKATELAPYCYNQLLYGCNANTRLPKELPAENPASNCYRYFSNGGAYTDMPVIKATSATSDSFAGFLSSSIYVTKADLSSIKQISGYRTLNAAFKNCSALNYIKIGWKQWANPSSLSTSWVEGVSSQGTFVMPYNIEFDPESIRGVNGIPEGWEVKYYDPDNPDDVRDNKEDFYPQEINTILESIITGEELDNMDDLLQQISQSQVDMSLINTQLENIINT